MRCALEELKHLKLTTQILMMHYPVEDIRKKSRMRKSRTG